MENERRRFEERFVTIDQQKIENGRKMKDEQVIEANLQLQYVTLHQNQIDNWNMDKHSLPVRSKE